MKARDDKIPIGVARWLVTHELERIRDEAGPEVSRDIERAIQALIDDAVETALCRTTTTESA
jgi:hypothetical protein